MATPPTICAAHSGAHQIHERHLSWTERPSTLRRSALSSLGALGTAFAVSDAAPLPPGLLSAARLHAMSEAELWALPPLDVGSDVPLASAASEWRALTKLRRALCPGSAADLSPSVPAEEVAQLLRALCAVEVEPMPLRRHSSDANARALLAALGGGGGERVAVVGCSAGGRGLVAASPIASDEVVVSLPAASLVSGATARAELPAAVVAALEEEGEWCDHLLVMHLLMRERGRGAASPLAAWLGLLPRLDGAGVPPSAWSDDELEAAGGAASPSSSSLLLPPAVRVPVARSMSTLGSRSSRTTARGCWRRVGRTRRRRRRRESARTITWRRATAKAGCTRGRRARRTWRCV